MADASKFPPVFYGEVDDNMKAQIAHNAAVLTAALIDEHPLVILNIAMLLLAMGMSQMETEHPDEVANEIADCTVRTFANCNAYLDQSDRELN